MHPIIRRALAAASLCALAPCQGIFVPGPVERPSGRLPGPMPVAVETAFLQIKTTIVDGAATTELRQTLKNRTPVPQEAWWLLPLPPDATADRFTLSVNGQETQGEVLDSQRARGIYEEIVRKRRDPGLLEYLGGGLLRARVFPIPPQGEVQVAVRYVELLRPSDGVTTWRFPVRAAWSEGTGPQRLGLAVDIRSALPIKTVWSPCPGLDLVRDGEHHVRASLELDRGAPPPRDLALHYGTSEQDFGAHVLTFRPAGADGYFLLLLAPRRDWPVEAELARSINLVLDTSGSMAGEKIAQARAAVRTFLQSLAPRDYFNVIPFSTDARPFFGEPVPASKDNVQQALARVDELAARGGTNIDEALTQAFQHATPDCSKRRDGAPELVPITVFLTDGLPTVGITDVDQLLQKARAQNGSKARVFVFGVGHDVNTRLLDTLAQETRGDRDYVQPGEDIEQKTSALFTKLSGPVMTDLQLAIDGIAVSDQEPRLLPDLFVQGQLAVVGRYRGEGHRAIRLQGRIGKDRREYVFEATFPASARTHDWLPSLWAQKRVAALLDAIRLNGQQQELVAEVTRLGKEFGIVTPYTSHLVVEEGAQIQQFRGVVGGGALDEAVRERLQRDWERAGITPPGAPPAELLEVQEKAKEEARLARAAAAATADSGAAAVEKSTVLHVLADGLAAPARGATALLHQRVRDRSFHLVQGVWVDAGFTAAMQDKVQKIAAFSDAYFALLAARPHLAVYLACSPAMVVVDGEEAFEITAAP